MRAVAIARCVHVQRLRSIDGISSGEKALQETCMSFAAICDEHLPSQLRRLQRCASWLSPSMVTFSACAAHKGIGGMRRDVAAEVETFSNVSFQGFVGGLRPAYNSVNQIICSTFAPAF